MEMISYLKLSLIIVFSSVYLLPFLQNFGLILKLSIVNLNKTHFLWVNKTLTSSNMYIHMIDSFFLGVIQQLRGQNFDIL